MQEIMAGFSDETLWFPRYYIGWIGIGNYDQETSNKYLLSHCCKNNKRQTLGDSLNRIEVHLSHKVDIKLDLDLFPLLPLVNGRYSKVSWVVVGLGWKYSPKKSVSAVFTKSSLSFAKSSLIGLSYCDLRYFPSFLSSKNDDMLKVA